MPDLLDLTDKNSNEWDLSEEEEETREDIGEDMAELGSSDSDHEQQPPSM